MARDSIESVVSIRWFVQPRENGLRRPLDPIFITSNCSLLAQLVASQFVSLTDLTAVAMMTQLCSHIHITSISDMTAYINIITHILERSLSPALRCRIIPEEIADV